MKKEIADLIEISRYYGGKKDFVLGGGGNTSYKDRDFLYVKASGFALETITEEGFAILDRQKLGSMMARQYSQDTFVREQEVMEDLMNAVKSGSRKLRPSVEASLHNIIDYPFVVHTHPCLVNALLCANDAETMAKVLFDNRILYVPYTDPGYVLSVTVSEKLADFRTAHGFDPRVILLQNHGVFVGGDTVTEVKEIYSDVLQRIGKRTGSVTISSLDHKIPADEVFTMLSDVMEENNCFRYSYDSMVAHFTKDWDSLSRVDKPFIPDQIVYCKAYPAVIPATQDRSNLPKSIDKEIGAYIKKYGSEPRVILFEKGPVIAADKSEGSSGLVLDVFLDAMKISFYSNFFGGPHFMSEEQIKFIEQWEVEQYRRKISTDNN